MLSFITQDVPVACSKRCLIHMYVSTVREAGKGCWMQVAIVVEEM
jgi:hypothetical protein